MHRIIGKVSLDKFFHEIISLIGRTWFRSWCRKLSLIAQGLREWRNGIRQRHVASEAEGLGSTYDKRKWSEAYYAKPDKAMTGYSKRDLNNA
ncbi:hypothetical protein C8R32_1259 [Nitrosospira sp. Nsp5]|uniref:Uncharacterized protein n=1 Tax=Nitrosospira multiformis TaxID=1231 RepID=A0ABY0TME3_9PROT|nr:MULTISPECIES: hypothetical protein [Nitrosospira]PTR05244.1 hypothetical protein C8R32_1259 [Nitrosospira sp. Nsp5]SDQ84240.1 hypothetical protein SAMN05216402_2511 [Nitrosospira multiformis]